MKINIVDIAMLRLGWSSSRQIMNLDRDFVAEIAESAQRHPFIDLNSQSPNR
jgi:hypothetical protein